MTASLPLMKHHELEVFVVLEDRGAVWESCKEIVAIVCDRDAADSVRLACADPERVYVETHTAFC